MTSLPLQPPSPAALPWTSDATPDVALLHWPGDRPVVAMRISPQHTLLASPLTTLPLHDLTTLDTHLHTPRAIGTLAILHYELAGHIEPTTHVHASADTPPVTLIPCTGVAIHDARTSTWSTRGHLPLTTHTPGVADTTFHVGPLRSLTGRAAYEDAVRRTIEYIHAGDIFQANIAHHLRGHFAGSPRALGARLLATPGSGWGAYAELPRPDAPHHLAEAVISISPELFLALDGATRRVITRPIKGTRPAHTSTAELRRSAKDTAELVMIVDLMRNDLGRVCRTGSIRVTEARTIETHGDVHHAVATIEGALRDGGTIRDLLHATFPPGSITGAPKIRAMQIIRELEPRPRGPYCGAIGWIDHTTHDAAFNVAIRTARLRLDPGATPAHARGHITYPVGAGIVADSDPAHEWQETLDKASSFLRAINSRFDEDASR